MNISKVCIGCKKEFTPKWKKAVYCSISCSKQGGRNPTRKHKIPTYKCPTCGKDFIVTDHPERKRKYCSRPCSKLGSSNPMWKEEYSYRNLHTWANRHLKKPEKCDKCGKKKPLDLANISNEYKRDLSDWEFLCRSCHMKKDGRINNLMVGKTKRKDIEPCIQT